MDDQGTNREGGGIRFRKLRIAVSVFFALLGVAFCALWLSSYFWCNLLTRHYDTLTTLGNNSGRMYLVMLDVASTQKIFAGTNFPNGWKMHASPAHANDKQFEWTTRPGSLSIGAPHWFLILLAATTALAPWIGTRFSLRTLLIVTTLVAIVLGLAVWAVK